jgi:hypothetical protein
MRPCESLRVTNQYPTPSYNVARNIMKRIVCAGLGWRLGSNQAHCPRALRIQLIELNRGGGYGD